MFHVVEPDCSISRQNEQDLVRTAVEKLGDEFEAFDAAEVLGQRERFGYLPEVEGKDGEDRGVAAKNHRSAVSVL